MKLQRTLVTGGLCVHELPLHLNQISVFFKKLRKTLNECKISGILYSQNSIFSGAQRH